jgi:hypothetical protein
VRLSRTFLPIALCVLLQACEREIPPVGTSTTVTGYRIEGFVLDGLGNPVRGLPIAIYYDYGLVDAGPPPTKVFQPTVPTQFVRVTVYDRFDVPVVTLFQGRSPEEGTLQVNWDQRDAGGNPVPSGAYTVQYIVDGKTQLSYPVVVSGNVVTSTDSTGHYVIPDKNLPVGFYPVPLYSADNSKFLGNWQITADIIVELRLQPSRYWSVVVTRDQITEFDIRL